MKTVDAGTGEEPSRGDLVRGFAVAEDEYVLLDTEDFESVKLESTRIVDIEKFVPRETIDHLYWDTPYHLVPSGKTGIEAFAVIREAMKRKGLVAIGRLVMSTRERVCAIEIEEDGLVLTTLRTAGEVRTLDEIGHPDLPKPNAQMLDIAEKIVAQQSDDFDPAEFTDRYEDAPRALIEEKKRGKPVKSKPAPAADESGVVDLMAALKKSLQGDGPERKRTERYAAATTANKKKPARRKAA